MLKINFKKLISLVLAVLIILMFFGMYHIARKIYRSNFSTRYTTNVQDYFTLQDFGGLTRERYVFDSDKGQKLVGYLYSSKEAVSYKGVIVFAHGLGGGGQTGYMDVFDYMTQRGYRVFAYDATGNDESEGEAVGGLPQGIIDLDRAVSFVKTLDVAKGLPVSLMGYSWGGLSVVNVLNYHKDIYAVISLSGFNRSVNLLEDRAEEYGGKIAKVMIPFAFLYEVFTYGKYAFCSGVEGLENSDCRVMVVHSADDDVVPICYGYDIYYEKFADNTRFDFKRYNHRGHDIFKNAQGELDTSLFEDIVGFLEASPDKN